MNRKDFRKQYVLSILLTVLAALILFVAIVLFIFGPMTQIVESTKNKNELNGLLNMILLFLKNSWLGVFGCIVYLIGVIWNCWVSFKRGETLNNLLLGKVVTSGWVLTMVVPFVGWIFSGVIQTYGWREGSKDLKNGDKNDRIFS